MTFINLNGNIMDAGKPVLHFTNRGFHYGDGLFETMRWQYGSILFYDDHWERLTLGAEILKMNLSASLLQERLLEEINTLVSKNEIKEHARIRITLFREKAGKYQPDQIEDAGYLIEAEPLMHQYEINRKGLRLGIFEEAKKTIDIFSNLKTCSALLYVMASIYAKEKKLDDCLLLNQHDNICEATSSNVFVVRSKILITPALAEGCVAGVMRKQVIHLARQNNYKVVERDVLKEDIEEAEEVFLTNVITGIRWVKKIQHANFTNRTAQMLMKKVAESSTLSSI